MAPIAKPIAARQPSAVRRLSAVTIGLLAVVETWALGALVSLLIGGAVMGRYSSENFGGFVDAMFAGFAFFAGLTVSVPLGIVAGVVAAKAVAYRW
jgi:hypothetical protein